MLVLERENERRVLSVVKDHVDLLAESAGAIDNRRLDGVIPAGKVLVEKLDPDFLGPRPQNVSIGINIGTYSVDIVPGRRQGPTGQFHSLYRQKAQTWTQTNVISHISTVRNSGRAEEIMIVKAWREQKRLAFPSFFLELVTIEACRGRKVGDLSNNVLATLDYIRDNIRTAVFIDPANTNNRISDDLTAAEKQVLAHAAFAARKASKWNEIVV